MTAGELDVRVALRVAAELLDRRRLQGCSIPPWLIHHHQRLRTLSACGLPIDTDETQSSDDPINCEQAAAMLNTSTRQVRRIAADLGGIKVGRDWHFDRVTVQDYAAARNQ